MANYDKAREDLLRECEEKLASGLEKEKLQREKNKMLKRKIKDLQAGFTKEQMEVLAKFYGQCVLDCKEKLRTNPDECSDSLKLLVESFDDFANGWFEENVRGNKNRKLLGLPVIEKPENLSEETGTDEKPKRRRRNKNNETAETVTEENQASPENQAVEVF